MPKYLPGASGCGSLMSPSRGGRPGTAWRSRRARCAASTRAPCRGPRAACRCATGRRRTGRVVRRVDEDRAVAHAPQVPVAVPGDEQEVLEERARGVRARRGPRGGSCSMASLRSISPWGPKASQRIWNARSKSGSLGSWISQISNGASRARSSPPRPGGRGPSCRVEFVFSRDTRGHDAKCGVLRVAEPTGEPPEAPKWKRPPGGALGGSPDLTRPPPPPEHTGG
jgi:hypothetical protein